MNQNYNFVFGFDFSDSSHKIIPSASHAFDKVQILNSESEVSFFDCNARSLVPKADVLLNYTTIYDPFVIVVTETY